MPVMRSATTPDICMGDGDQSYAEVYGFFADLAVRAFTPELVGEVAALAALKPGLQLERRLAVLGDQVALHVLTALRELGDAWPGATGAGTRGAAGAKRVLSLRSSSSSVAAAGARTARQAAARAGGGVRRANTAVGAIGCVPRARRAACPPPEPFVPPPCDPPVWATSCRELDLKTIDFVAAPPAPPPPPPPPAPPTRRAPPAATSECTPALLRAAGAACALSDAPDPKRRSQGFAIAFAPFAGLRHRGARRARAALAKPALDEFDDC